MNRLFTVDHPSIVRIHDQLKHLVEIGKGIPTTGGVAEAITRDQLAGFIEIAFWASLRTNEERPTRFSALLIERDGYPSAVAFAEPMPFEEDQLAKVAPAIPPGGCLTVSMSDRGFAIWGLAARGESR